MPGIFGGVFTSEFRKIDGNPTVRKANELLVDCVVDNCQLSCVSLDIMQPAVAENDNYLVAFFGETFGIIDDAINAIDEKYIHNADEIIYLIESYGVEAVEKLDGAFITAIYDKKSKILNIYNDRFGLYPLYYIENEEGFFFAQEAKLLGQIKELEPDYVGIAEYLSFDYCIEDRTMFKNVKYMLPGQRIIIDGKDVVKEIYWQFPETKGRKEKKKKEYMDDLNSVMRNSVLLRKSKTTNVIGLTGGFDSRLILAILDGKNVSSFNFGNKGGGDQIGASYLADTYKTNHYYMTFDNLDFAEAAKEIVLRSDGQCPFERFYVLKTAEEKAKIYGGVEISGMGGDAISGQKSNFTGLIPIMSKRMTDRSREKNGNTMLKHATRGRIRTDNESAYGPILTSCWTTLKEDYSRALSFANKGETFGNYTMRLKLRTLERRVTMSSMWLVNQFLPIRFPIYDYAVINFFNTVPQSYRFGQRLYIRLIQDKYPKAAMAPHSETGKPIRESHCVYVDLITVRDFVKSKLGFKKSGYNNSFGFVNDAIKNCDNLRELVCIQEPQADGIFNMTKVGTVEELIEQVNDGDFTNILLLKNIIHISLMNKLFFNDRIHMYYREK